MILTFLSFFIFLILFSSEFIFAAFEAKVKKELIDSCFIIGTLFESFSFTNDWLLLLGSSFLLGNLGVLKFYFSSSMELCFIWLK